VAWIDADQDTDAWLELRIGKIGGSTIGKVMARFGKEFGKPAHDVAYRVALETLSGERVENSFTNKHTERGNIQEPIARKLYEEVTGYKVTNGGFFDIDTFLGFSPDGLVAEDGMIEIKSVIKRVHDKTIKRWKYDPKYKWQMIYSLKYSKRKWIDYIEYCSDYPIGDQLFIDRIWAKDVKEEYAMIDTRIEEFLPLIHNEISGINGYDEN